MKPFYKDFTEETLTVEEFISFLLKYPREMPVVAEWEGVKVSILPKYITIEDRKSFIEPVMVINVDSQR